jgi:hypothetical protein
MTPALRKPRASEKSLMADSPRLIALALTLLLLTGEATHAAEITESATSDGVVIAIRGDLEAGDDRKFDQVAQRYSKGAVYLESHGGDLVTGIAIGESIRLKGFVTFLPPNTTCASSCALAWLGGSRRFLSPTSRLGFHAAYQMDGTAARETGIGNAVVGAYLTRIGLPVSAVIYITKASPETMTWLTPADAQKVGIEFSFIEDANKSVNQQSQPSTTGFKPPPSEISQPTQKQTFAGNHYEVRDGKVVQLNTLPERCAHTDKRFSFIGRVVKINYYHDDSALENFVLEKPDGANEIINVGALDDLSMADKRWVMQGLQIMLREGEKVRGIADVCREGQRVMFLEQLETATPPTPDNRSFNERYYEVRDGKVVELRNLDHCAFIESLFSFIGRVAEINFGGDGVAIDSFVLEKLDGTSELINIGYGVLLADNDLSHVDTEWIEQGLQTILRKGQGVSGTLCQEGQKIVLRGLKQQGPTPVSPPAQAPKLPKAAQVAHAQEPLAASSVNQKCPIATTSHYRSSCGRIIEISKLVERDKFTLDCLFYDFDGKVVKTNIGDDGVTITGFALEDSDRQRSYINVSKMPSDVSISEVKTIMQGLRSILRQGQNVAGEVEVCGSGSFQYLEEVKADSTIR